jgi:serine/threonine-protein kinase HipA
MRKAKIFVNSKEAGTLIEIVFGKKYQFNYLDSYQGNPISLTMSSFSKVYEYDTFPPFFDGLLPEGYQLEGLLKFSKIDRNDLFGQLVAVGADLVGSISVGEVSI